MFDYPPFLVNSRIVDQVRDDLKVTKRVQRGNFNRTLSLYDYTMVTIVIQMTKTILAI